MGADLVGYLVVGPKKLELTDSQVEAELLRIRNTIKKITTEGYDWNTDDDRPRLYETGMFDVYESMDDPELRALIRTLAGFWNNPDERDTVYRDDDERRTVFAGEMSWGDAPEGNGYTSLDQIFELGLDTAFGLG